MYLRSVRLRGFKSFPDPVEVRLEPGVAVVVGPNGSGKSNVADAIVWAAGSLSPTELRAEKPDDVLYSGSKDRPPAEWCEVELVFDNVAGEGPLEYSELSVMRRLHRGGEGQYLVNRAHVRRADVVELLADIGLGGEMHSVVGQGRVEQILASKPRERRALVEEAAGLGRFKRRRHRAELKLARVETQAERARDLEDEVRKRLRPLALQASAAERAEKLGREIERLRTRLAAAELERLERRLADVGEQHTEAALERRRRDERLEGVLAERRRAEEGLAEAATRHEHATAALYRLRSALERLELRRERAAEDAASLRADAEAPAPAGSPRPASYDRALRVAPSWRPEPVDVPA
ncbi:MAG TPA: AAA family ATPase, partial [Gaiellaceae bacterium]|nr:AAA family ATPase [Gaiellaceae bacterium]